MNKEIILLSHGTGGKYTQQFINDYILKYFSNEILDKLLDSAILNFNTDKFKLAFTTDSYTVNPIFFPGGDIGKLSICGTINDLLCVGAIPKFISLSLIMEEGIEIDTVEKILCSIKKIAEENDILVVTGDTKVVEHGSCDKIFITTSGIGIINNGIELTLEKIQPTDVIIINGNIAEHGLAVLLSRGGFGFEYQIESDCSSLKSLVELILQDKLIPYLKFFRDPTRGGVAAVLNEIVNKRKDIGITIYEELLPVDENVKNICELLGFEPLYIANEGKIIMIVKKDISEEVLSILKTHPQGKNAKIIGEVTSENKGRVILKTVYGAKRILDIPFSEELPRIC
ncbi:MAG: hydrogenase expression/formation protein HypE [Endomicrobia bacterium]|nr:hydrogenase expression/formation protein HypE [Endomicrobiia bacterium]